MAQKPRPSGTIKTPNYPRLSTLAIAAALSACNGEVKENGVEPDDDGRGGATTVDIGSTAGVMEMPYGGSSANVSSTGGSGGKNTTVIGSSSGMGGSNYVSSTGGSSATATGGIGNLAGGAALPFGGAGTVDLETTGGSGPTDNAATGGTLGQLTTSIPVFTTSTTLSSDGATSTGGATGTGATD